MKDRNTNSDSTTTSSTNMVGSNTYTDNTSSKEHYVTTTIGSLTSIEGTTTSSCTSLEGDDAGEECKDAGKKRDKVLEKLVEQSWNAVDVRKNK